MRNRRQGKGERIRDFAFSYRALCNKWNSSLPESTIVKMIFKNINPHLASQLRGRVNSVDELVCLGHQLEKDFEQQQEYGYRTNVRSVNAPRNQKNVPNRLAENPVLCWRCNGQHPSGQCPNYRTGQDYRIIGRLFLPG